jgi:hypothetical protein
MTRPPAPSAGPVPRPRAGAARAPSRTGRPGARTGAPRAPFVALVLGLTVGGLCALLALNTASAANELRRHDLAARDTALAAQREQVQNEVAASSAPGALQQAATRLGMVPADDPAFIRIGADGRVRVLGSPGPATAAPLPPPPAPVTHAPAKKKKATSTAKKGKKAKAHTKKSAKKPTTKHDTTPTTPTTQLPGGPR